MYFDPSRNAYIDEETGEVVFHENEASTAQSSAPARTRGGLFSSFTTPTRSRMHTQYTPTSQDIEMASYQDVIHENDKDELVITKLDEFERLFELAAEERQQSTSTHKKKKEHHQKEDNVNALEQQLYNLHVTNSYDEVLRSPANTVNESHTDLEGITIPPENDEHINDWNFARTLQMLEFEITNEGIENDEYGDFNGKEYRASRSCRRQLATISFVICIVQIALLIAMCEVDGQASYAENPTIGPPAYSMVRFGAKEAALIVYKHEW